jgi:uncharacterized repeat protein (TIGR02543 family)
VFARFGREAGVGVTPSQNGSVVLDPPGGVYAEGAVVHATAIPDPGYVFRGWSGDLAGTENPATFGYVFRGWSGDLAGTENPATFVVEGDMTLAAAFGGALLNVTAGQGGGVTLDPPGPTYPLGSVVTLTANPTAGHLFTGWGGDLTGAGNPATLVMDADTAASRSGRRLVEASCWIRPAGSTQSVVS